jgi:hypothetical protein
MRGVFEIAVAFLRDRGDALVERFDAVGARGSTCRRKYGGDGARATCTSMHSWRRTIVGGTLLMARRGSTAMRNALRFFPSIGCYNGAEFGYLLAREAPTFTARCSYDSKAGRFPLRYPTADACLDGILGR